jgi:hypothetical protein
MPKLQDKVAVITGATRSSHSRFSEAAIEMPRKRTVAVVRRHLEQCVQHRRYPVNLGDLAARSAEGVDQRVDHCDNVYSVNSRVRVLDLLAAKDSISRLPLMSDFKRDRLGRLGEQFIRDLHLKQTGVH